MAGPGGHARGFAAYYIDDSELFQLEVDLRGAPGRVQRAMPRTMMVIGERVDEQMTIDATGHKGNWFGIPGTGYVTPTPPVSHELIEPDLVEAGIENRGSGKLFHIIAYGSVNNEPAYDPWEGVRRALPAVEQEMVEMGEQAVFGSPKERGAG